VALADGIAVKQVGHEPFAVMQRYVDEVVCVEE
jgi:threonine dehydratase